MTKTNSVNTGVPAGTESPRQGDNRIRALAAGVVETLQVDHYMGTPTDKDIEGTAYDSDDAGKHRKITFAEDQEAKPTLASLDTGAAYTKSGELYYEDASGNEKQITNAGKLNVLDADGAVMKTGNQTIAGVKTFSSAPVLSAGANCGNQKLTSVADPSAAQDAATKGYVDGKFPDDDAFGSWASKAVNTTYTAESDGFVVVYGKSSVHGHGSILGYTPVATLRVANGSGYADVHYSGITMPVKKGDTWKVTTENWGTGSLSVRWLPVGG